jgi:hypothetical protein
MKKKVKKKWKKTGKKNALWITVIIHSGLGVCEQWIPAPFNLLLNDTSSMFLFYTYT